MTRNRSREAERAQALRHGRDALARSTSDTLRPRLRFRVRTVFVSSAIAPASPSGVTRKVDRSGAVRTRVGLISVRPRQVGAVKKLAELVLE